MFVSHSAPPLPHCVLTKSNYSNTKYIHVLNFYFYSSTCNFLLTSVQIIGPDEWGFEICVGREGKGGENRTHSSRSSNCAGKMLFAESIDVLEYERFLIRVEMFLKNAQKNEGEDRSAAGGEQGHQKTPVFHELCLGVCFHTV